MKLGMIDKDTVEKMITNAIFDYSQMATKAFKHQNEVWEIGKRTWYDGATEVICRLKRPPLVYSGPPSYNPGYTEQVTDVSLENLIKNILLHCGIEIEITPKKEATWEIVRKSKA